MMRHFTSDGVGEQAPDMIILYSFTFRSVNLQRWQLWSSQDFRSLSRSLNLLMKKTAVPTLRSLLLKTHKHIIAGSCEHSPHIWIHHRTRSCPHFASDRQILAHNWQKESAICWSRRRLKNQHSAFNLFRCTGDIQWVRPSLLLVFVFGKRYR